MTPNASFDFSVLKSQLGDFQNHLSVSMAKWISGMFDIYEQYMDKGYTQNAASWLNGVNDIIAGIGNLEGEQKDIASNIFYNADLSSISGVQTLMENLAAAGISNQTIDKGLQALSDAYIVNLPLAIQSYTDKIVQDAEEFEKNIRKLNSGMSFSEAIEVMDRVNAELEKQGKSITLRDFSSKNGKLVLDRPELQQAYINSILGDMDAEFSAVQKEINKYSTVDEAVGEYKKFLQSEEVGEGLTVRMELPEDYFTNEGYRVDKTMYLYFLVPSICLLLSILLWYLYGKDDNVIETVEFYPPEGYNSLEIGFLYKGKADNKDVTSLLIHLANKGYLRIHNGDYDFSSKKLNLDDETLEEAKLKIAEFETKIEQEKLKDPLSPKIRIYENLSYFRCI